MARSLHSRLIISGNFVAETPLHIGGLGGNIDSDMALAVNGKGEFYIPGTSLTGVLRAWCEKHFGKEKINPIFGFQIEDNGQASFVLIEDATVKMASDILSEIRDGVGIDRFYGVAAEGAKYNREILPGGTEIEFKMTVEIDKAESEIEIKAILGHLLESLQKSEIRFGGSRTRGLGKLRLDLREIKEQKLKGKDEKGIPEILKLFSNGGNSLTVTQLKGNTPLNEKPGLKITIDWLPVQPLMVKGGFEGIGVDMLPLVSQKQGKDIALVLPGSSIKGALRSHAERIMRTILDLPTVMVCDHPKVTFHDQIKQIPLVEELFGAKAASQKNSTEKGRIGALAIDDCFAEKTFDRNVWNEITAAKTTKTIDDKEIEVSHSEQPLWNALEKVKHKPKGINNEEIDKEIMSFAIEHHNAIDRFTGGAADTALYSVLAPTKISWDKMQFSLDFSHTDNPKQCLMLFLLVLRDLAENRLPLGFATNRGMGEIKVTGFVLSGTNLKEIGVEGDVSIDIDNGKFIASHSLKKVGGEKWWVTH